jgi:hypothetical protein
MEEPHAPSTLSMFSVVDSISPKGACLLQLELLLETPFS